MILPQPLSKHAIITTMIILMPLVSEITPLLIVSKLEQYDYLGATALAVVMLAISFFMLLAINLLQWWAANRGKGNTWVFNRSKKEAGL